MKRKGIKTRTNFVPTLVNGKPFKCPKCGCDKLEEVVTNCTQSSSIASVEQEGGRLYPEYENTETEGGELERIQCVTCGRLIARGFEELQRVAEKWPAK